MAIPQVNLLYAPEDFVIRQAGSFAKQFPQSL